MKQIIGKLREAEVELARGKTVPVVVRKHAVRVVRISPDLRAILADAGGRDPAVERDFDTRHIVSIRASPRASPRLFDLVSPYPP